MDTTEKKKLKKIFTVLSNVGPGFFTSGDYLGALDLANTNLFEGEDLPDEFMQENFKVTENVYAGYLMTEQDLSEKLSVLAGVRLAATDIESTANEIIYNEDGDIETINPLEYETSYSITVHSSSKYSTTLSRPFSACGVQTIFNAIYQNVSLQFHWRYNRLCPLGTAPF